LIKNIKDARGELGLVSGSNDMCQGPTILLDDYKGSLPLNPTTQDISFGNEIHGQVKKDNLNAWLAGVTHFYWNMQLDLFGLKSAISTAVANCAEGLSDDEHVNLHNVRPFEDGNFTRYEDVVWRKKKGTFDVKKKRRQSRKIQGCDTLVSFFKIPETPYDEKKTASKKRKANAMVEVRQEHEMMINQRHHQPEIDRLKQQILEGEASRAQLLQIKDMQKKQIKELTAQVEENTEQIKGLTAQGEEHAAAELEWKSKKQQHAAAKLEWKGKKQQLKQGLRERNNRVLALESETQPNHQRDQVTTLRRQLQMAQDDCRMKEDLSQQAEIK
jgi:hypothetical protein